ncbi:hypothetical protein HYV83_02635 [Candidatus Woesearchaeota archaeon]|nr:hypothetical protein [Candidatus Woesearchaeota archaeon]
MGLEKVKQEILERAQAEADKAIDAAQSEAKAVMKSAEKQVAGYERMMEEDLEALSNAVKRKEVASAELELKKQLLSAKSELIEGVFRDARKKLGSLPDKKRESHITALLDAARKEMNVSVVQCSSKDARFVEASGSGDSRLKVVKNDEMLGGIIAESPDGRLRVDYSYDILLGQVKSKVLGDVAKILFGQ